jgi:hypothetical protein
MKACRAFDPGSNPGPGVIWPANQVGATKYEVVLRALLRSFLDILWKPLYLYGS